MPKAVDHMAMVVRDPARSARLLARVFGDARVESGQGDHDTLVWLAVSAWRWRATRRRPRATATTSPSRWTRPNNWRAPGGCVPRGSNS